MSTADEKQYYPMDNRNITSGQPTNNKVVFKHLQTSKSPQFQCISHAVLTFRYSLNKIVWDQMWFAVIDQIDLASNLISCN